MVSALVSPLAVWQVHSSQGWSLVSLFGLGLVGLAFLGLADALTCRVELYPNHLVIVSNFAKRTYVREAFSQVTWAKGVHVSLQLVGGGWLRLPTVGTCSAGIANSLRAWLRGGRRAA